MTRRRLSAIPGTLLCAALVAACAAVPSPSPSAPPVATAPATVTTIPSTGPSAGPTPAATPPGPPARYDDGLPRTLGGLPVIRGAAALARAAAADDAPFLLAGWVTNVPGAVYSCTPWTGPKWLAPCGQPSFSDVAGDPHPVLVARGLLTFRMADASALESGPAILRVHVNDPRAAQCGAESAACARAMVVEAAVWTGDAATAPRPLEISAVSAALRSVVPGVTLAPLGPSVGIADCGVVLATSRAYAVPAPASRTPTVSLVEIAPSAEALARALPIPAGPSGALAPEARVVQVITSGASGTFACRWLRISNVAVLVRTSDPGLTSSDAAFVRELAAVLGEAAQASPPSPGTGAASQAPATTLDNPTVTVSPSTGLRDGQAVTVSVTGFVVGGKAWVSECASSAAATDLGCGAQLAGQTLLVTDDARAGSTTFTVQATAPNKPLTAEPSSACTSRCVIVVTLGDGLGHAIAPISFTGSGSPAPPGVAVGISLGVPGSPVFAGDRVTLTVVPPPPGGGPGVSMSSATVDFGDGTTATASAACAPTIGFVHTYGHGGDFTPKMAAVTLCDPTATADLSFASGSIHAFPSAPAASATWPVCSTFQLAMAGPWTGAGLGNVATQITLTNVGRLACTLEGYPDVILVGADSRLMPTHASRATTGAYMFPAVVPHRVALAPGDVASFMLGYSDNPYGPGANESYSVACPASAALRVILPGTHQFGTAKVPMGVCEGVVDVSPVVPGAVRIQFP